MSNSCQLTGPAAAADKATTAKVSLNEDDDDYAPTLTRRSAQS